MHFPLRHIIFLLVLNVSISVAQRESISGPFLLQPDSNRTTLRFERNVYTYLWNVNSWTGFRDTNSFVTIFDQFNSSFIKRNVTSFRDENTFALDAAQRISSVLFIRSIGESYILSDNQALGVSKAGIHSGLLGVTYQPVSTVRLTPLAGVRFDKQQDHNDEGVNFRLLSEIDSVDIGGYRTMLSSQLNYSSVSPRTFRNNNAVLGIAKEFSDDSGDSLRIRLIDNRWDFYIPADMNVTAEYGVKSNIRSRTEQGISFHNILGYGIGDGLRSVVTTSVESRTIANLYKYRSLAVATAIPFNTSVQELRLFSGIALEYQTISTLSTLGLTLSERDEKHSVDPIDGVDQTTLAQREQQERKLDNTAVRTGMTGSFTGALSRSDRMRFDASLLVLHYDTPDTVNTDDRDELLINLSVREEHTFSPYFQMHLTAEATLAHLVYLLKEKSANNNWNRIFRLMPETFYRPSESFTMYNAFEVLANYTAFDFETVVPSVKSYSYRQVAFLDSTSYDMTRTLGIDVAAYVRLSERGELRWKEFTERPEQYVEEITFSPQVRYTVNDRWYFAVGFRSFAQKKYIYNGSVRSYSSGFASAGPTTRIIIRLSPHSSVEIFGWKEFQKQSGTQIQEFSNMSMNVSYQF